jgi:Ser/Thr protein kinase RdoA (MazF antagonist)
VLGIDGAGREVLSYVPGEAVTAPAPPWALTDASLASVGQLLRRFHEAAADFDPTPYTWSHDVPEPFGRGGVAHNDPNLDNVVFRNGRAVALIDFDLAAPGAPVWDVAAAARLWAPLRAPADIGDSRRYRELERLRVLVDAYGLDGPGRADLLVAVLESHEWMCDIVRSGAIAGIPGFAEYWTPEAEERNLRARAWLRRNADAVAAVLS